MQTVTPEQKILLEKMQFDQLVREGKAVEKEVVKEAVEESMVNADISAEVEVEGDEEVEKEVEKAVEKPDVLELTFVSSLTFAEMMLLVHKELNSIKNKNDGNIDKNIVDNIVDGEISGDKNNNVGDVPLFYNPLTLVVKGNVHNAELSLLRREGTYVRTPHEFVLKCHELVLICV